MSVGRSVAWLIGGAVGVLAVLVGPVWLIGIWWIGLLAGRFLWEGKSR